MLRSYRPGLVLKLNKEKAAAILRLQRIIGVQVEWCPVSVTVEDGGPHRRKQRTQLSHEAPVKIPDLHKKGMENMQGATELTLYTNTYGVMKSN